MYRILFRDFSVKVPVEIKINISVINISTWWNRIQLEEIWKALENLGHGFYVHRNRFCLREVGMHKNTGGLPKEQC